MATPTQSDRSTLLVALFLDFWNRLRRSIPLILIWLHTQHVSTPRPVSHSLLVWYVVCLSVLKEVHLNIREKYELPIRMDFMMDPKRLHKEKVIVFLIVYTMVCALSPSINFTYQQQSFRFWIGDPCSLFLSSLVCSLLDPRLNTQQAVSGNDV